MKLRVIFHDNTIRDFQVNGQVELDQVYEMVRRQPAPMQEYTRGTGYSQEMLTFKYNDGKDFACINMGTVKAILTVRDDC